jgi:endonuclease/exonuclease/phosphatase family metal-dependent hydrolase
MKAPLCTALAALSLASCEPLSNTLDFSETDAPIFRDPSPSGLAAPVPSSPPPPATAPEALRVMAWNIKYGAGRIDFWFDYHGDRVQMTLDEVRGNLDALCALIREVDPDILMTEEIEVGSRRSAYVDMVAHLLACTDLAWAAYFQSWDARYVPTEGLGRVDLGNAIFSRYPIRSATRIKQVERSDLDALTGYFYIRRVLGRAVIDLGAGREVAAWVAHVEAYDNDGTKQAQIRQLFDLLSAEPLPWIMGGDLNELPPVCDERVPGDCDGKLQLSDFNDENAPEGDAYAQPPYTPSVLKPWFDAFTPAIDLARYGTTPESQRRFFTHTTLSPDALSPRDGQPGFWNRTLDYLFVRGADRFVPGSTAVLQAPGDGPPPLAITSDPMQLSDHAPIVGTWEIGP